MPVEVSVVVEVDEHSPLQRLVRSVDRQTMGQDKFEVVLVPVAVSPARRDALLRIAARRPNVRLATAGELPEGLADLVLVMHPGQSLFPQALARLTEYARVHGLDVVAGRVVQPRQPLSAPFLCDALALQPDDLSAALQGSVLFARRERISHNGSGMTVDARDPRIGVLAGYPAVDEPEAVAPAGVGSVKVAPSQARWEDSVLVVEISGTATGLDPIDVSAIVALRQLGTHLTYLVACAALETSTLSGDAATFDWGTSARIAPLAAALGEALPDGCWELDLVLSGATGATAPRRLSLATPSVALLEANNVVVAAGSHSALQIDVGPSRHSLVQAPSADGALVTESARGSVLRVPLPEVNVQTDRQVDGAISLDRLRLPASIQTTGGTGVLVAFVSGLAGTSDISAQFGTAPMTPTGLSLSISPVGQMTVIATPAEAQPAPQPSQAPANAEKTLAPSTPPKSESRPPDRSTRTSRRKPRRSARGPVAKIRRAVPSQLEPLVDLLRRSRGAKRIYRRLTGLAG